jgi:hypothetical protein
MSGIRVQHARTVDPRLTDAGDDDHEAVGSDDHEAPGDDDFEGMTTIRLSGTTTRMPSMAL